MDDLELEAKIRELKLNAPRVTLESVENAIRDVDYYVFPHSQLTVCCITLRNGYTVTGESACASPENFNEKLGRDIAYQKAKDKIWPLEGYLLKQALYLKAETTNG